MTATVLEIVEKTKTFPFATALPENFVVRPTETVDAQIVRDHPHISLYCLDDAKQEAWFVETPPDVDLAEAPFYYVAQYDHALRAFSVPYDEFHQLADTIPPANVIFVHSTGRCGSTLISKTLNTVEGVRSLSEPDIYTQILFMRHLDRNRDTLYSRLLRSATLLYGKGTPTLAVKFRAMVIYTGDLLNEQFPEAKQLFLYRNMESWARSMGLETRPVENRRVPLTEFPIYRQAMTPLRSWFVATYGREANGMEWSALSWLSLMEGYVALCEMGQSFLALRYEDIQAHPKRVLAATFDYCGLTADVDRAYDVFAHDSQEGTLWSRASREERVNIPLEAEERAWRETILQQRPVVRAADYIAPNTMSFED